MGGDSYDSIKQSVWKNIKYLRTAYGETQLDLALVVGLDSPNAIANYEKGERTPKPEIKKKIALHYRITEDELVHSDFSGMQVSSSQLGNEQKMIEMSLLMCPITCTDKAMKDSLVVCNNRVEYEKPVDD